MVLTFGISFPLTLTLFWILSVLEIRVDLFKYVHFNKRGLCSSKPGIGIWFYIVEIVGVMCIATNIIIVLLEFYFMHLSWKVITT